MAVTRSFRFRLSRPGRVSRKGDGEAFGDDGELEAALFPAAEGDPPVVQGAERGVPNPGDQGGAGAGVHVAGEVVAGPDPGGEGQLAAGMMRGHGRDGTHPGRVNDLPGDERDAGWDPDEEYERVR